MSDLGALYRDILLPVGDPAWMFDSPAGPGPAEPWQREFMADPALFKQLVAPRRVGKTETEVLTACTALLEGRTVLCCAPTLEQSYLAGRRIRAACAAYAASDRPDAWKMRALNQSRDELILEGGGIQRNLANKNPDNIRGYDLDRKGLPGEPGYRPAGMVLLDELAFNLEADELWRIMVHLIQPNLRDQETGKIIAPGGQAIAFTTPGYIETLSWRIATGIEEGWSNHVVTVEMATRTYTPERLEQARKMAGVGQLNELDLEWRQPADQVFFFQEDALDDIFGAHPMEIEARASATEPDRAKFSAIWTPGSEPVYFGKNEEDDVQLPEVAAPVKKALQIVTRPTYKL